MGGDQGNEGVKLPETAPRLKVEEVQATTVYEAMSKVQGRGADQKDYEWLCKPENFAAAKKMLNPDPNLTYWFPSMQISFQIMTMRFRPDQVFSSYSNPGAQGRWNQMSHRVIVKDA